MINASAASVMVTRYLKYEIRCSYSFADANSSGLLRGSPALWGACVGTFGGGGGAVDIGDLPRFHLDSNEFRSRSEAALGGGAALGLFEPDGSPVIVGRNG